MNLDLSHLAKKALPAGMQADFYVEEEAKREVGWAQGKPSLQDNAKSKGLCLRVLEKGKQGVLTTHNFDPAHITTLLKEAHTLSQLTPEDPHRQLAQNGKAYPSDIPIDSKLFDKSIETILHELAALEKEILKVDKKIKKVIRLQYENSTSASDLINVAGLSLNKKRTVSRFMVEILAENEKESEVGWDTLAARFSSDIDMKKIGLAVAEKTVRSLGGRALTSGRYPVVVDPRVGIQFLELLTEALSAEEVYLGRSFLKGLKGKSIATSIVNLIDDPLLKTGVASEPFDDEGTPHQTLAIVKDGVLQTYLYDLRSAHREGIPSTGHGVKASLAAKPRPHATNFYLKPGSAPPSDLLAQEKKVFYLEDVMGLHMADPMTGEFSLGASGVLYEDGSFSHPVRGVTIAGNLNQIFKKVTAVANDLKWYGSMGSPSFLISDVMIAGR